MGLTNGKVVQRLTVDCSKDPVLTVQADAEQADVNKIMARFERTGQITHLAARQPVFGEVDHLRNLSDALIKVREADELFMGLDARVRERFGNDPAKFVAFFDDERNRDEAVRLGLAKPKPSEPAVPAPGAPEAPSKPA